MRVIWSLYIDGFYPHSVLCISDVTLFYFIRRFTMWTTPAATEMRFGFEVTMYVMNK